MFYKKIICVLVLMFAFGSLSYANNDITTTGNTNVVKTGNNYIATTNNDIVATRNTHITKTGNTDIATTRNNITTTNNDIPSTEAVTLTTKNNDIATTRNTDVTKIENANVTNTEAVTLTNDMYIDAYSIKDWIEGGYKIKEPYKLNKEFASMALLIATVLGKTDLIPTLTQGEIDLNAKDVFGRTPLHLATIFDRSDIIQLLADLGVKINARDDLNFNKALLRASKAKAEALTSKKGWTPLHWAVWSNSTKNTELLIKAGAKLDVQDAADNTPLHLAVMQGYLDVVKLLVFSGADRGIKNMHGRVALNYAETHPEQELRRDMTQFLNFNRVILTKENSDLASIKKILKTGVKLSARNEFGSKALLTAIASKEIALFYALIEGGVDVNAINRFKRMPVTFADKVDINEIEAMNAKTNELIVKAEALFTPLMYATRAGDDEKEINPETLLSPILKNLPKANEPQMELLDATEGWTPLHWAVWYNFIEGVDLLIDNNANLDIKDALGRTPLHLAAIHNYPDIAKKLIVGEADLEATNNAGETALEIAEQSNHEEIAEFLRMFIKTSHNKTSDKEITLTKENSSLDNIRSLVKAGFKLNANNEFGVEALLQATILGETDLIPALTQGGVELNVDNFIGLKVLDIAKQKNDKNTIKVLKREERERAEIEAAKNEGIDLEEERRKKSVEEYERARLNMADGKDNIITVPLTRENSSTLVDIERLMSKRNIKIDARNKYGEDALIRAVSMKRPDIVQALIKGGVNVKAKNGLRQSAIEIAKKNGSPEIVKMLKNARPGILKCLGLFQSPAQK